MAQATIEKFLIDLYQDLRECEPMSREAIIKGYAAWMAGCLKT